MATPRYASSPRELPAIPTPPIPTPSPTTFVSFADGLQRVIKSLDTLAANDRRVAGKIFRDAEALIQQKQKDIARWERTSAALQRSYGRSLQVQDAQLLDFDAKHSALQSELAYHQEVRRRCDSSLEQLDTDLTTARSEAHRTSAKKRRRERNLNHYYFIPLLNRYMRHKYLRTQTKNAVWEDRLREIRTQAEEARRASHDSGLRIAKLQTEIAEVVSKREEVATQAAEVRKKLTFLHEGAEFWRDLASFQCEAVARAGKQLRAVAEGGGGLDAQAWERSVLEFRMACLDLLEGDEFAKGRWEGIKVAFECTKCHGAREEWPGVTKDALDDLLCSMCYAAKKRNPARAVARNIREISAGGGFSGREATSGGKQDVARALRSVFARSASSLVSVGSRESRESRDSIISERVPTPGEKIRRFFPIAQRA